MPRIDPSGKRIALTIGAGRTDLWSYEFATGTLDPLTNSGVSSRLEWHPDGEHIIYVRQEPNQLPVYNIRTREGSGPGESFSTFGGFELSVGPKGTFMAMRRGPGATGFDVWIAPVDSPQAFRPFITSGGQKTGLRVSPDGKLIAFVSTQSGQPQVYVHPLPGQGPRVQVSTNGGTEPVWHPNGKELFYRANGVLRSAQIARTPELAVTRRDSLFVDRFAGSPTIANYDVFPSGDEFVMIEPVAGTTPFVGIGNWDVDLRRRLAAVRRQR
jgi:serine/threonine-protein kinase